MKARLAWTSLVVVGLLAGLVAGASYAQDSGAPAGPLGTAFTYQGRLTDAKGPVEGRCDFDFKLYDAASGGKQLGLEIRNGVEVAAGYFTVRLDYGAAALDGGARWLEIDVNCNGGAVTLSPRQELTPAPYALWAADGPFVGAGVDNSVSGGFATVGGGMDNVASGDWATVGGGMDNEASRQHATVAGGDRNEADHDYTTVGGGSLNRASQTDATVAGGSHNEATGPRSAVGGGYANLASGNWAAVGGGEANQATDDHTTVGGGTHNKATAYDATVGGGGFNVATGQRATVGGGYSNQATADYATVAGGGLADENDAGSANFATDKYATVGGGGNNLAGNGNADPEDANFATVGGGGDNQARGPYATVSGGDSNRSTGYGSVGGGQKNKVSAWFGAVAGGTNNLANGGWAAVGGGRDNQASGTHAAVAGGEFNKALGGNTAVGGGAWNTASGYAATVPGGEANKAAGDWSFAAGRRAKANHRGSFVWADSTTADFASSRNDEFAVRANGGVRFVGDGELQIKDSAGSVALATRGSRVVAFRPAWQSFHVKAAHYDSKIKDLGRFSFCMLVAIELYGNEGQCRLDGWAVQDVDAYGRRPWSITYHAGYEDTVYCTALCF